MGLGLKAELAVRAGIHTAAQTRSRAACAFDKPGVDGSGDLAEGFGRDVCQRLAMLGAIEKGKKLAAELKLRACSTLSKTPGVNPSAKRVTW
jgi:hypothetical protein